MALPPVQDGAAQATVSCPEPGVTVPATGAFGTVRGVPATRGVDGALVPAPFVATTSTYAVVPFTRPSTTQLAVELVQDDSSTPPLAAVQARAV